MTKQQYGDYGFEIYFDGLEGRTPNYPLDYAKGSCFFEAGGIIFGLGMTPGRGPRTAVTRARATTRADADMAQTDARYATRDAVTHGAA